MCGGATCAAQPETDGRRGREIVVVWYQGRVYIPWNLDTAMKDNYDVFAGGGGDSSDIFTAALFRARSPRR